MDSATAVGHAINVGTGTSITVRELAETLARDLGIAIEPQIAGRYRAGDIRHCWADMHRAEQLLGFRAQADRVDKLRELAAWVAGQTPVDRTEAAGAELVARGLIR
jgi:dTDP-L-rhamnose 4-epimerase